MSRSLADQMIDLVYAAAEKLANSKRGNNRSIAQTPEWKAWCAAIRRCRSNQQPSEGDINSLRSALAALDHPTFPVHTEKGYCPRSDS